MSDKTVTCLVRRRRDIRQKSDLLTEMSDGIGSQTGTVRNEEIRRNFESINKAMFNGICSHGWLVQCHDKICTIPYTKLTPSNHVRTIVVQGLSASVLDSFSYSTTTAHIHVTFTRD